MYLKCFDKNIILIH